MVESGDRAGTEPFCGRDDGGVPNADRQVRVLRDEVANSNPVIGLDRLDRQMTRGDCSRELNLWPWTDTRRDEVTGLRG